MKKNLVHQAVKAGNPYPLTNASPQSTNEPSSCRYNATSFILLSNLTSENTGRSLHFSDSMRHFSPPWFSEPSKQVGDYLRPHYTNRGIEAQGPANMVYIF